MLWIEMCVQWQEEDDSSIAKQVQLAQQKCISNGYELHCLQPPVPIVCKLYQVSIVHFQYNFL